MNKIILRGVVFLIISNFFIAFLGDERKIIFFNTTPLGAFLIFSFVFGIFYLWGCMFYHWGTHNFKKKWYKVCWFWSMLLGLYVGAIVYYIFVYELGKTLQKEQKTTGSGTDKG